MRTYFFLLLLALLGTAHCTSAPRWRSDSGDAAPPSREEFDPHTLDEDLLIEPVQRESRDQAQTPAEPAAPVQEHAPSASTSVYRLQLVALSDEAMARQRRAELERALGVKVYLVARNAHSVLQAGQYATRAAAAALKEQVAALGPDYADAYVVEVPASAMPDSAPAEAVPELVSITGWRVLIDQFLSHDHDKAIHLAEEAKKRLKREDINVTLKGPYYKIEVGNYRTEAQAQAAAERIGRYYPNALKVRSQILISQEE
ncbi:MAG: SPOR domain-containing protein [Candidatus Latescibacteria bacterium]|nr:SPOR domain-containing protein [Candidatus Latescibacterota bacterium]